MSDITHDTPTVDAAPPRRLVRVNDGRWLGGVAAGLGRYFDVNPLVYRIAFGALAFVGGTGLLLYLAAWLVIPSEDRDESIAVEALRDHRERPWLLLASACSPSAAVLTLSEVDFWSGPGNLWLAATLVGGALVWAYVIDRDRTPAGRRTASGEAAAHLPVSSRCSAPPRRPRANGRSRSFRRSSARCSSPPDSSAFSPCSMCTTSTCPSCWPPRSRSSEQESSRASSWDVGSEA